MGIVSMHSDQFRSKNYSYRFSWLHLMRPMTFSGTISPIVAGTAIAALNGPIRIDLFIVLIIAALFVQISANMFNDYFDFKHGQDQEKWTKADTQLRKGPLHQKVPYAAIISIGIAIVLGAWLSSQTTWWLTIVGSAGILAGIAYSAGSHSFSALGLGEVVAATFLGFVTTFLGYVVQGYAIDGQITAVAITYALLIATMILTNNIRDLKKDLGFRHTLAMRMGKKHAVRLLTVVLAAIYGWAGVLIFTGVVPWTASTMVFALPVAFRLCSSFREGASREEEIGSMGWAGKHHWTFGLLFALGIWLSVL